MAIIENELFTLSRQGKVALQGFWGGVFCFLISESVANLDLPVQGEGRGRVSKDKRML